MDSGWRVISWTLDVTPSAYYEASVEPNGLHRAQYFERDQRSRLGRAESLGDALLLCARHAETHEVAVPRGCSWRATSWDLHCDAGRYMVDLESDGSAHAVLVGQHSYEPLGRLADLGSALVACTTHQSLRALREAV